ncbi:MAG: cation transporter [Eubacterium sp.]|nr:cation transporter [Eubacterium sp.]
MNRDRVIVRTSIIGIIANLFLVAFKAAIGLLSNSIAIVLDAVNNLSDALSSLITIVGTKLASRKADKKHPLGYGRIEYLTALIVSGIVLYAGITSAYESIHAIFDPQTPNYKPVSLIIIGAAVIVKLILGLYVRKKGKEVNSGALAASGSDALFDAVLSVSVLGSALIYVVFNVNLEAYVGVIISVVIIKAGLDMMIETLDDILGKRVDREVIKDIKNTISQEENVMGVYDLIMHSYGPDKYVASAHVEIPDTMTCEEIDILERRIADRVYAAHGVIMTGVGIYAVNTTDEKIVALRREVTHLVMEHDGVIQMHGFHVDNEKKNAMFDLIIDYEYEGRKEMFEHILNDLYTLHPEYTWTVVPDIDF